MRAQPAHPALCAAHLAWMAPAFPPRTDTTKRVDNEGHLQDDAGLLHALLDLLVWQHCGTVQVQLILHSHILTQHALVLQAAPVANLALPADDALVNLHSKCTPNSTMAARQRRNNARCTSSLGGFALARTVQACSKHITGWVPSTPFCPAGPLLDCVLCENALLQPHNVCKMIDCTQCCPSASPWYGGRLSRRA